MDKYEIKKKLPTIIGSILAIGIAIGLIVYFTNANKIKNPSESGYLTTSETVYFCATGAAKAIVNEEILYPRNSEFEDEKDFTVYYDKELAQYTVKGIVYAANGFGVKQKKFFTIKLTLSNLDKDNYSYRKISCSIT